ncbi:putative membrane protein [Halorhabdus sp. SVX81]|uniref:hypothetical protein n=1 Tax=Halorhabdus sp. SVX81 TaxID=2978283 RepID=UPI0023DACE5A|nr:hypothetical protein [Halorhabdus sp. SVX81]WEL17659.1 putative membrane protein [Halorhabdus sp. SVX81]
MPLDSTTSDANPLTDYIEEGARIAAILLVWGIIAVAVAWVFDDIIAASRPGAFGLSVGSIFWLTGILNAILYVCFRTVDHFRG